MRACLQLGWRRRQRCFLAGRVLAHRHRGGGTGCAGGGGGVGWRRWHARRQRLGLPDHARRLPADQLARGARRAHRRQGPDAPRHPGRRPRGAGALHRRRPGYRPCPAPGRCRGCRRAAHAGPRQLGDVETRRDRGRHRQPPGLRAHRHRRHRQRTRPLDARQHRAPDPRCRADRRRAESRQLRRAAAEFARRGHRRQHRHHPRRAGAVLRGGGGHRRLPHAAAPPIERGALLCTAARRRAGDRAGAGGGRAVLLKPTASPRPRPPTAT